MPKGPLPALDSGVYQILNKVTGKVYVGSAAISLLARIEQHQDYLRLKKHHNRYLQQSYAKHGPDKFEYSVLERCPPARCLEREQYWIDTKRAADRRYGYNLSPTAASPLGVKHSKETREKFSAVQYRRMENPEARLKCGNAMRGKSHRPEAKAAIVEALKKRWTDPEWRARFSEKTRGQKRDKSVGEKISAALKGRKLSPEHAAKCGKYPRSKRKGVSHVPGGSEEAEETQGSGSR